MTSAQAVPEGSRNVHVYQGGTVWSVGSLIIALIASARMWSLVPGALERFAFPTCTATASSVQLNPVQIGVVAVGGLAAIVLAEYGIRRRGNRWLSMIASVLGAACLIGAAFLVFVYVADPATCTP